MADTREFRKVAFGRKLDVKRLRAVLAQTMRSVSSNPDTEAAPARLESVLIEPTRTTVYLSGNGPTLDAVTDGIYSNHEDVEFSKTTRAVARRLPKQAS